MRKKMLKKGLPCILALFLLTMLLIGCPDPGSTTGGENGENGENGGNVGANKFFTGSFEGGNGKIELLVQGLPLTSKRSLARSLTDGSDLIAHIEHNDLKLRLEGAYDPKSDGFVLSARTEDFVYSIFGQLDSKGDFQFAEISVTEKENDEWKMRSHMITHDPTITLAADGFDRGLGGVPSGLAGNVDIWIPWFLEDENHRRWSMISPAAMVEYKLDPEKGFPEEEYRWNFIHFENVGADEANVITMSMEPTTESWEAAFPMTNIDGWWQQTPDEYGNTSIHDMMVSAAFNKPIAGWGDLDRYYDLNIFNNIGKAVINQNKAAITAAFDNRDEWAKEFGFGIWWEGNNMIHIELWDELLDREAVERANPEHWLYDPEWDRAAVFAEVQANGEVFTVDDIHYKVWWEWSFRGDDYNTWRDNLTQTQWEQIQNSTGKVFYDYVWKYHRDITSNEKYETFLMSKGVVFAPYYERYRIGKDAYGPTSERLASASDPADPATKSGTNNFSEALTFTHFLEYPDYSWKPGTEYGMGDGRTGRQRNLTVKLSDILSALSNTTKPASDFEGKSMAEVFAMLNGNNITTFEELNTAVNDYMTPKVSLSEGWDDMDNNISIGIACSTAPYYSTDPRAYSFPIISDGWSSAGLRNSTRVRPTLYVNATYMEFKLPEWWNPEFPGKITQTVTKTLMEVLAELEPGMAIKNNPDANYDFASINFTEINTWGDLAIAMGHYMEMPGKPGMGGEPDEPPTKTPQMFELTMALDMYVNNAPRPDNLTDDFMLEWQASGMYHNNGEKVSSWENPFEITEDTPFVNDAVNFKMIYSRHFFSTGGDKGGEEGGKGEGSGRSIRFKN